MHRATHLFVGQLRQFVAHAQVLPTMERYRDVAVLPDEIVEGAQIEFVALLHSRVGEQFDDLQFTS